MSARLIATGKYQSLRADFLPWAEVEGNIGERTLWDHCMRAASVTRVEHGTRAEMAADLRGLGEIVTPAESDHAIWFTTFGGLLTGGVEKGLLYVSDDNVDGMGHVVDTVGDCPYQSLKNSIDSLLRRIEPHWYIYCHQT